MPNICLYFQVHQPYRLKDLRITEIGKPDLTYFDDEKNRSVFRKVAEKCYLPANTLMLKLLEKHPNFSVAYCLSGIFLEQCEQYGPDVLESFRALAETGKVEFLAETYYHSLSAVHSLPEFCEQVAMHSAKIEKLFGQRPTVFRNTELVFSNEIAQMARHMGFQGILAEGADHILCGRSPNEPYVPPTFDLPASSRESIEKFFPQTVPSPSFHVLLKNYRLSDDVAFRFSDKTWIGYPLHADTFTDWLLSSGGFGVNLFMDYETFGEHQWEDTGIFAFLEALPRIWEERGIEAKTPSQVIASWKASRRKRSPIETHSPFSTVLGKIVNKADQKNTAEICEQEFDAHLPISWADVERDLSAWQGNRIQQAAIEALYNLENAIKKCGSPELLKTWRLLQTSDHFYYMCTKYWRDGDVHKYFSPYESPYEAYRRFSHAICDLKNRLENTQNLKSEAGNQKQIRNLKSEIRNETHAPGSPVSDF